jgi:hypothetical protein
MSASSAWQLFWWVGAIFCVLAGAWFLVLTVPDGGSPLAWVLAPAFGLVCIAAAASLRRLLRARLSSRQRETSTTLRSYAEYSFLAGRRWDVIKIT